MIYDKRRVQHFSQATIDDKGTMRDQYGNIISYGWEINDPNEYNAYGSVIVKRIKEYKGVVKDVRPVLRSELFPPDIICKKGE